MNSTNLSDLDIMQDILTTEKQISASYNMAVTESSCPNLRHLLSSNLAQSHDDQFVVFSAMHTRDWYPTKDAADADVQIAKSKMSQIRNSM